jgi:hypothetical protein
MDDTNGNVDAIVEEDTVPNESLIDMWLAAKKRISELNNEGPVISLSSRDLIRGEKQSARYNKLKAKTSSSQIAIKDELDKNCFIPKKRRRKGKQNVEGPTSSVDTVNSTKLVESVKTRAEESIFFVSTASKNVMENRTVVDMLSLLCLDTPVDRIEMPHEECTTFAPIQRCTEKDFVDMWKDSTPGMPTNIDEAYNSMMDPGRCKWTNAEWVCGWIVLVMTSPLKLLHYFSTMDEICVFFSDLQIRGAAIFGTSLHTEHVQGSSIGMILYTLHGIILAEFEEFVHSTYHSHRKYYLAPSSSSEEFLYNNMLVTMRPHFNCEMYTGVLTKLGIVPFPHRMPYKMDLWDIEVSLVCTAKAWKTWTFWYGGTFNRKFSKAPAPGDSAFEYSKTPLSLQGKPVTMRSCCQKEYLIHLMGLMEHTHTYLGWLRFRFSQICAHGSMDIKDVRIKGHMFLISGLLGILQTFVNTYRILYEENDRKLLKTAYTLSHFIESVYTARKDPTLAAPSCKVLEDEEVSRITASMSDVPSITADLVNETLSIATYGVICDDIIAKVERAIYPIQANIQYHSRAGGHGTNTRMAMKETSARSSFVNQHEFMDITAGSMSSIENGLPPDTRWAVDFSLQLQGIDTSLSQIVSTFIWSQKYLVDDLRLPGIIKDLRPWPKIDEEGNTYTTDAQMTHEDLLRGEPSGKSMVSFRDGIGGYRTITVVRLGCTFLVYGHGHTFCTPSIMEAFHAWAVLKDAYEGWLAYYYISYIAEDKSQKQKMVVCELEEAVKYILHRKFMNTDTFRDAMDDKVLDRISKRVDASRRGGKRGLTEDDIEGTQKT